ncbi:hypothetical protein FisN_23Lh111 [Fistulifera solaris]|uniref:RRM domain-containing protein n=1 Tax=Fistulifera solaris TaxID=1519565 RepID=A0A1Z5KLW4_FISSO|nr:hypothetical protein FisN_23Lh111 [Fistulifera solaris]|eukprot:GAX27314.1 hypothetical protein FisN_23Lh111 [Fistulifera solaris]
MNAEKEETEYSRVAGLGFLPQAAPQPGASFADEMMQRHLQQCLEYHEQQLQSADTVPHFVKAMQVEEDDELIHQEMKGTSIVMAVRQTEPPSSTVVDDATKIQVARDRAQEIISRFQQQQQHFLSEPPESFTTGTSVFAAVRRISLAKEEERKQRFLEKNLKYVSAREQQRMHQQAAELSAAEEWNREYLAIIEERQQQRYETQKQRKDYIAIQAGIGASFRKNLVDRQFQKGGGVRNSIAVYVSGFEDSSSVDENVLRDLFRTYGNIEKIHLYRDKIQGNMKGDGLIIFEGCQNTEEFLDTVCQQVRVNA